MIPARRHVARGRARPRNPTHAHTGSVHTFGVRSFGVHTFGDQLGIPRARTATGRARKSKIEDGQYGGEVPYAYPPYCALRSPVGDLAGAATAFGRDEFSLLDAPAG